MDGRAVYQEAVRLVPDAIENALIRANLSIADIDYVIPHQPSKKILEAIADKVGLYGMAKNKVLMNMDKYANTSAGTIPILLAENWHRFKKGDRLLFAAIGAGWTYGAIVYEV